MKKRLSVVLTVSSLVMIGYVMPAISGELDKNNPDGIYITEIADSKLHRVEFVELFNARPQAVSLSGWVLEESRGRSTSGGEVTTIPLTGKIPANGFVIVA